MAHDTQGSSPDRASTWASTMAGHVLPHSPATVRFAHATSTASTGSQSVVTREQREENEAQLFSPLATLSLGAGVRAIPESPDLFRTCFERDRDRILHANAFRRLAGKTQVFVFPDDHQRTRLTHALEVAQVATAIARALGLNVALTEAIAIGHDCGHGPGGHASEDALSPYIVGGYDHAQWGADVTLNSLNLCRETLDGIRNHSWSRPAPLTPEGEVVSWADRIAYVCHDFEDAVAAGIVSPQELPAIVQERCGTTRGQQLAAFINAMVNATEQTTRIAMNADIAEALGAFRQFNYERVYLRPESQAQAQAVITLLRALVEHYKAHPHLVQGAEAAHNEEHRMRIIVEYVGGMTDQYAFTQAQQQMNWRESQLPRGITP